MSFKPTLARLLATLLLLAAAADAFAAVTYVTRTTRTSTGTTSLRITASGSVLANDLLLAQVSMASNVGCSRITPPSGWTLLGCTNNSYSGSFQNAMAVYYKIAVSGDANTSFRWSFNTTTAVAGAIWVYRGVDTTNPIDAGPVITTFSNSRNATTGTINTQTNGAVAITMVSAGYYKSGYYTPPGGWTERGETRSYGGTITLDDMTVNTPASVGPVTTTTTNAAYGVDFLFAIRPPGATLVAYYPFDGVNWLADGSGYNYSAAANGTAAAGLGKVCTGFAGDGSGWITVADNANQSFTTSYSITAWVRPTGAPGSDLWTIISKNENYELHITPTGNLEWWYNTSASGARVLLSTQALPPNVWTHVAVVFDRATSSERMYINGSLNASWSYADTPTTTTIPLYIGSDYGFTTGTGTRNFQGSIDEVRLYKGAITQTQITSDMNATHGCAVDHYRIITDGLGLTCSPESLSLLACVDSNCTTYYSGAASVNLSVTGTVSPAPTITPSTVVFTSGSGAATLTYGKAGTATLSMSGGSPTPAGTAGYRCIKGGTEVPMSSCSVVFSDSRFTLDVPILTACMDETDVTITSDACTSTVTGNQNVNMSFAYSVPNSGSRVPKVKGNDNVWHNLSTSSMTTVPLTFDTNGMATFTLNYPDAGQITLNANATVGAGTIQANATTVTSVPDYLVAYTDTNCAAGSETNCPVVGTAGGAFTLRVKAACWEATRSAPSAAPATPNFALSSVGLNVSSLVAPVGGVMPALSPATFDFPTGTGIASVSASVSEVGVFRITPVPPVYTSEKVTLDVFESDNIGRFIPDHYGITPQAAADRGDTGTCTGSPFVYMGEPLKAQFVMSALNASGAVTKNYTGGFVKFDPTKVDGVLAGQTFGFSAKDGATLLGPVTMSAADAGNSWGTGTGETGTLTAYVIVNRPGTATPPYTNYMVYAAPVDPDQSALHVANTAQQVSTAATQARYGRLRVSNTVGSSKLPLQVPLYAEYWQQAGATGYWALNADDSCTSIAASRVGFGNYQGSLTALTANNATLSGGQARMKVAPTGTSGQANMALQLGTTSTNDNCPGLTVNGASPDLSYLSDAWCGGTQHDPAAHLSVDVYGKGNSFIYLRENY